MKPNKIFDVLNLARRARGNNDVFNPLFVGAPGLGKTEIVQQWAESVGLPAITMTLSSYDPPDFKGFPTVKMVEGRQRMSFATPDFWPDAGEGIVILEEMNRAPTSIMQCILSLTDKRRGFDGYTLPTGWIVVGCINPENGDCDVNTMDPALKDRFEMFNVSYDKQSFMDYARGASWNIDLLNFIEAGMWTYRTPEDMGNVPGGKYISPRTFSKLNAAIKAGVEREDELLFFETILGNNIAKDFHNFRHNETPVMMSDLLKNLKVSISKLKKFSDPNNYKNGMISLTVKDIVEQNIITDDLLIEVALAIPVEQSTVLIRELEFKRKDSEILRRVCKQNSKLKDLLKAVLNFGNDKK